MIHVHIQISLRTRKRRRKNNESADEDIEEEPPKKRRKKALTLTDTEIDSMKLADLKKNCKTCGLKQSGKKRDIQQRLKDFIKAEKKKPKQSNAA